MGGMENGLLFLVWFLSVAIPVTAVVLIIVLLIRIDRRLTRIESSMGRREPLTPG